MYIILYINYIGVYNSNILTDRCISKTTKCMKFKFEITTIMLKYSM